MEPISRIEAKVIEYMKQNPDGEFCIGDLKRELGLKHPTAYVTIKKLLEKGFVVKTKKIWKTQYYRLNEKKAGIEKIEVSKDIDERIFHALQVARSVLIKSKNKYAMKISFGDMVNIMLIIACLSNIKEDDPRIKDVINYIKGRKIQIDEGRMERLGERLLRALYYY